MMLASNAFPEAWLRGINEIPNKRSTICHRCLPASETVPPSRGSTGRREPMPSAVRCPPIRETRRTAPSAEPRARSTSLIRGLVQESSVAGRSKGSRSNPAISTIREIAEGAHECIANSRRFW